MVLDQRKEFTEKQCELVAGHPYEDKDQDSFEDLMIMEDKEIRFWTSVNKLPNFMEQEEWDVIVLNYNERLRLARLDGIQGERDRLDAIFQTLEVKDLSDITIYGVLPKMIEIIVDLYLDEETNTYQLISRRWDEILCDFDDMWKYEGLAKERAEYYNTIGNGNDDDDRYEQWLDHKSQEEFLYGATGSTENNQVGILTIWPLLEREVKIEEVQADVKTPEETRADMVDAMNAIEQYHKNVKEQEQEQEEDDGFNF